MLNTYSHKKILNYNCFTMEVVGRLPYLSACIMMGEMCVKDGNFHKYCNLLLFVSS